MRWGKMNLCSLLYRLNTENTQSPSAGNYSVKAAHKWHCASLLFVLPGASYLRRLIGFTFYLLHVNNLWYFSLHLIVLTGKPRSLADWDKCCGLCSHITVILNCFISDQSRGIGLMIKEKKKLSPMKFICSTFKMIRLSVENVNKKKKRWINSKPSFNPTTQVRLWIMCISRNINKQRNRQKPLHGDDLKHLKSLLNSSWISYRETLHVAGCLLARLETTGKMFLVPAKA